MHTHTWTRTHTHTHMHTHRHANTHPINGEEASSIISSSAGHSDRIITLWNTFTQNAKSAIFMFIRPIGPRDNGIPLNENASNLLTPGLGRHDRVEWVDWQVGCRNKRSVQTDSKLESKWVVAHSWHQGTAHSIDQEGSGRHLLYNLNHHEEIVEQTLESWRFIIRIVFMFMYFIDNCIGAL